MEVSFDRYSFKINNKRELILSGAIHYYRLPSHDLWKKRILAIKECGLNAIDVYFPWNYHSPKEGNYDFSGIRDVDYLLDLIEENNLYLIARPGPYICSEVDAGGFPGWLLNKDVSLRCQKNGEFFYDAEYMRYVREWYEQIVPKIAKRKNLILFQIENEYNFLVFQKGIIGYLNNLIRSIDPKIILKIVTSRQFKTILFKVLPKINRGNLQEIKNNQYIKELYNLARELGIKVPIFHNDVSSLMGRVMDVDVIGIDDYSVQIWDKNWKFNDMTFIQIDVMEKGHNLHKKNCPIFIAEFQGGWFDMWGGIGYDNSRKIFGTEQIDISTKSVLSQGVNAINWFVFSGGTTIGYLSSPDVYTSYDFAAPISEFGEKTERYNVIKSLIEFMNDFKDDFLENEPAQDITSSNKKLYFRARKSKDKKIIFLRNLTRERQRTKLNISKDEIEVEPAEMKVLIFDKDNRLINMCEKYKGRSFRREPKEEIVLKDWKYKNVSPQIYSDYDDSKWNSVEDHNKMDIDSLNLHYGFVWYRTKFKGTINKIKIDARHLWTIYLNGKLFASFDNFHNVMGAGSDYSKIKTFNIHPDLLNSSENTITILVESLGHNKGFEEDSKNPRGIISVDIGQKTIWKYRGGLVSGEEGLIPVVDFSKVEGNSEKNISTPYFFEDGVGLCECKFKVNDNESWGLEIESIKDKANIYLNGYLIGRYWEDKGPQKLFYLPEGILTAGENHLAIAIWRRKEEGYFGRVKLIKYEYIG